MSQMKKFLMKNTLGFEKGVLIFLQIFEENSEIFHAGY